MHYFRSLTLIFNAEFLHIFCKNICRKKPAGLWLGRFLVVASKIKFYSYSPDIKQIKPNQVNIRFQVFMTVHTRAIWKVTSGGLLTKQAMRTNLYYVQKYVHT
jgi:hypothetical protein